MYILDTDHLSILDRDSNESLNLERRLAQVPAEEVATTVVTYEEQMRRWLTYIARAKTLEEQVEAYRRLRQHIERYRDIPVADFDRRAADEFDRLRKARVRVKSADMKIAAVALANNAILLTRNIADVQRIPGLQVADWTGPPR